MLPSRRAILASSLALPATALLGRRAAAADPLPIVWVYTSPVGEAGWTFQHELGRRAVEKRFGPAVKTSFVENVSEGADSERVIRKLAADGNKLVFTTSFGFMNPTLKVAAAYPGTYFEHATGYKRAENLATYSARFYEGRYLGGIVAGHASQKKVVGYVAAFPIPEVLQGINAFTLAMRTVAPDAVVKVVFTSSWFDPGKERAAADTLIAQGADLLTHHTDSTAVVQAGEEKGIPTVGYNSDLSRFGPRTCLTSVTMDWDGYYLGRVEAAMNGTWKPDDTWGGMEAGMVRMAPATAAMPAPAAAALAEKQTAMVAGKLACFAGPIRDQAGKERLAAGQVMPDKDVLAMNWFVQGVQGKA